MGLSLEDLHGKIIKHNIRRKGDVDLGTDVRPLQQSIPPNAVLAVVQPQAGIPISHGGLYRNIEELHRKFELFEDPHRRVAGDHVLFGSFKCYEGSSIPVAVGKSDKGYSVSLNAT